jgi:hypothetical protein
MLQTVGHVQIPNHPDVIIYSHLSVTRRKMDSDNLQHKQVCKQQSMNPVLYGYLLCPDMKAPFKNVTTAI